MGCIPCLNLSIIYVYTRKITLDKFINDKHYLVANVVNCFDLLLRAWQNPAPLSRNL